MVYSGRPKKFGIFMSGSAGEKRMEEQSLGLSVNILKHC
jgi:hypothetical protein